MHNNDNEKCSFTVLSGSPFPTFDDDGNLLDENGDVVIIETENNPNIDPRTGLTIGH